MNTSEFLQAMKAKAEQKAKQMAELELSVWDSKHESELINNFGFSKASLANRKLELSKSI